MAQTKNNINDKKTVAVFFGGRSPEHDVSVISALQAMDAIDPAQYSVLPVYIAPDGAWYTGDILRKRESFLLDAQREKQVTEVTLDVKPNKGGVLIPKKTSLFGEPKAIKFDIAMPVFHGLYGEDGNMQGLFEFADIPYFGMRTKASAVLMDKVTTKFLLKAIDIPALPYAVIRRPAEGGYLIAEEELDEMLSPLGYPCIIKPSHLGSSIGVAKVDNAAEAKACLPDVFEFDDVAIAEPFVQNLVEYNVAVARIEGEVVTSAIERPKTTEELLDFKQKYMSGGDDKGGDKGGGVKSPGAQASQGMLSLTRDINPQISDEMDMDIRGWAARMFEAIDGTGLPRIDFIGNSETGEIWMNEVNPCPGSLGYFLWEASMKNPMVFTDLLSAMLEEAVEENKSRILPHDPVPEGARLLKRS